MDISIRVCQKVAYSIDFVYWPSIRVHGHLHGRVHGCVYGLCLWPCTGLVHDRVHHRVHGGVQALYTAVYVGRVHVYTARTRLYSPYTAVTGVQGRVRGLCPRPCPRPCTRPCTLPYPRPCTGRVQAVYMAVYGPRALSNN